MVHLKWTEILEWTAAMSKQSLYAWQFHHFPSDFARRGWRLLLIGEDHHCYASINISMHHEFTIHRWLFSLVCHLQTILTLPSPNYSSSSAILEFATCKLLFPFDIWSLPYTYYCCFPFWYLESSIYRLLFPKLEVWQASSIFPPLWAERWEDTGFHVGYPEPIHYCTILI